MDALTLWLSSYVAVWSHWISFQFGRFSSSFSFLTFVVSASGVALFGSAGVNTGDRS